MCLLSYFKIILIIISHTVPRVYIHFPSSSLSMSSTISKSINVNSISLFYREAGPRDAPTIVLLHGFPSSSHQYRHLIPLLGSSYHILAPDLPGFGFTSVPAPLNYKYTFANLTTTLITFLDTLSISSFAVYIFDYGAPIALRLALQRPTAITALITQNGNAYLDGLGAFWAPLQALWASHDSAARAALGAQILTAEATKAQYTDGVPPALAAGIQPESYHLDYALLSRPGNAEIQLDLLENYAVNVALYPRFQAYLRASQVPVLAVWGRNDAIFVPAGAEAYRRDVPDAEVHFVESGHFALETHGREISGMILEFLKRKGF